MTIRSEKMGSTATFSTLQTPLLSLNRRALRSCLLVGLASMRNDVVARRQLPDCLTQSPRNTNGSEFSPSPFFMRGPAAVAPPQYKLESPASESAIPKEVAAGHTKCDAVTSSTKGIGNDSSALRSTRPGSTRLNVRMSTSKMWPNTRPQYKLKKRQRVGLRFPTNQRHPPTKT